MVTREAPGAQLRTWKDAWLAYKDRITPNRKTGAQIVRYLQDKYVLEETFEHEACAVVEENVVRNEYNAEKLPPGEKPRPRAFFVKNTGAGAALYQLAAQEDAGWDTDRIFVGVDTATGLFLRGGQPGALGRAVRLPRPGRAGFAEFCADRTIRRPVQTAGDCASGLILQTGVRVNEQGENYGFENDV